MSNRPTVKPDRTESIASDLKQADAVKQWAKSNPDKQAKIFVFSLKPKGKGGHAGLSTARYEYYVKGGKTAQQRCFRTNPNTKQTLSYEQWRWNGVHPETREVFLEGVFEGGGDINSQTALPEIVVVIDLTTATLYEFNNVPGNRFLSFEGGEPTLREKAFSLKTC